MLCVNPYRTGKEEFGCGKCLPCKFAKRRVWIGRMMLELHCHAASCFVTLTYKDEPNEFEPDHLRVLFKQLRRRRGPFRYLAVGERGKASGRRHYHVALFGVSMAESFAVRECWVHGFVDVGELNSRSSAYLVKYLLKDYGDEKPFRRMSLKPGIGGLAVGRLAAGLAPLLSSEVIEDVPPAIRVAARKFPLGSYVRKKVRVLSGRDPHTPALVRAQHQEEYKAKCPLQRERERENGYVSALCRLEILKSKEKLK